MAGLILVIHLMDALSVATVFFSIIMSFKVHGVFSYF